MYKYDKWTQSVTVYYEPLIIIYYVSEHQLPPIIDASHTAPTTCVNQYPKFIEINRRDIVHALGGFRTYSEPRPRLLTLNQALPQGS